jgi:hypothetical protein
MMIILLCEYTSSGVWVYYMQFLFFLRTHCSECRNFWLATIPTSITIQALQLNCKHDAAYVRATGSGDHRGNAACRGHVCLSEATRHHPMDRDNPQDHTRYVILNYYLTHSDVEVECFDKTFHNSRMLFGIEKRPRSL